MKKKKAVFLDRDGVLNRALVYSDGKPHPPSNLDELELIPGVTEACETLRKAGFFLIGVTNQPDVARGTQSRAVVEEINNSLMAVVPLHEIRVCYHDDKDKCDCRKPRPGHLLDASEKWGISLNSSYMVGDRWKDIEAGKQAGCRTILVSAEHREAHKSVPDHHAETLLHAVEWILKNDDINN